MDTQKWKITEHDMAILRPLAARFAEVAASKRNQEVIRRWYQYDEMIAGRPLLQTETDAGIQMVLPDFQLHCQEDWARNQELMLKDQLMHFEVIGDDRPLEPYATISWNISMSGYGVETHNTRPDANVDGKLGAYHIDPPLKDIVKDFSLLRHRTFSVNREDTAAGLAALHEAFDGILGVRLRHNPWWTMGLTQTAITLIGLEELMLNMYDEPEALHQLMGFLRDDYMAMLDWMEAEQLICLNNENDYLGSGSRGYTHSLPQPGRQPNAPLRTQDIWGLIESQETVGVSPSLYEEFIFTYEKPFAERFGGIYYGCCEPVHTRWEVLKDMPNLKRVSISPWCDQEMLAEAMGAKFGFSRKPNPTLVSTVVFDEEAIRADLQTTVELVHKYGCPAEIVMKDVHTLSDDPTRLTRWVKIAREVIADIYG